MKQVDYIVETHVSVICEDGEDADDIIRDFINDPAVNSEGHNIEIQKTEFRAVFASPHVSTCDFPKI